MTSGVEEHVRSLARPASLAEVGGFRPPEDPLSSWFGQIRVGLPGESWPLGPELPMLPLCQLNLREAPHRPPALDDVDLIAIWVDQQTLPDDEAANGDGWCLRAYPSLGGLVPVEPPPERDRFLEPFPIRWHAIEDFPDWEDLSLGGEAITEHNALGLTASYGTKLGGWPSYVQSSLGWWAAHDDAGPEYVLQVDSESKSGWAWGHDGVGYFGRGTGERRDEWALEWQSL
jgi:hypothetical protein